MTTRRDRLVGVPAAAGAVALVSMAIAVLDAHVLTVVVPQQFDRPTLVEQARHRHEPALKLRLLAERGVV